MTVARSRTRRHGNGQLLPLKKRLNEKELLERAARTSIRADHAKRISIATGLSVSALNNTRYLRRQTRLLWLALAAITLTLGYWLSHVS